MTAQAIQPRRRVPIEEILELWRQNWTLDEIGEHCGVSRQRISQRINAAGYSPAERQAQRRSAASADNREALTRRAENVTRRVELREEACARFRARAAELGVSPITLGQYVSRSGPYANRLPVAQAGNARGSGKLPPVNSDAAEVLGRELAAMVKPWSAMHIASMCRRAS